MSMPHGITLAAAGLLAVLVLGLFALLGGVTDQKPWSELNAARISLSSSFQYYAVVDEISLSTWSYCLRKGGVNVVCDTPQHSLESQTDAIVGQALAYVNATYGGLVPAGANAQLQAAATNATVALVAQVETLMSTWTRVQPILRGVLIAQCSLAAIAVVMSVAAHFGRPRLALLSLFSTLLILLLSTAMVVAACLGSKATVAEFADQGIAVSVTLLVAFWLVVACLAISVLALLLYWQGYYTYVRRERRITQASSEGGYGSGPDFKSVRKPSAAQIKFPSSSGHGSFTGSSNPGSYTGYSQSAHEPGYQGYPAQSREYSSSSPRACPSWWTERPSTVYTR